MSSETQPSSLGASPPSPSSSCPSVTSHRRVQSATVRHGLIVDHGRSLNLVKNSVVTESSIHTQSLPGTAIRRSVSCSGATRNPMHPATVQRWGGLTRTVSIWDGLRRDPELWYEDGDCHIHLHGKGASRRGPSFCIPFRVLRQKKCNSLLSQCDAQITSTTESSPQQLKRMPSSLSNSNRGSSTVQLFIPAPETASREDSFKWHITTRNFFAFLLGKPLVGENMGQAFVDLQERLQLFRSEADNHQDFLDYAENQGYRDLLECTDYALASLYYAEHYKLREVWIDAFAHCVGMNDSLPLSPEYMLLSRLTKALITRAYLEVDLHLHRVTTAISRFLEEDLSPTYLGLTPGARSHLDRFRRFLHGFYVGKFGYWPPPRGSTLPKSLYKSMYYDFKALYDYLVDTESTTDISLQKPASGGICVLQNVANFDERHNFTAQPHPVPLLPTYTAPSRKPESQKALRQITLASQHNKTHQFHTMSAALAIATNTLNQDVTDSKIVQAYMQFERVTPTDSSQREEKITAVDARKVRWLLIYGTLQYLVSALRAPKEVRDSEAAEYPLCCLLARKSAWNRDVTVANRPASVSMSVSQALNDYLSDSQGSPCTIQPDCHREDYFSTSSASRRGSVEMPAPLKFTQPSRSNSIRSFGPRSLSTRSSRRNSLTLKPTSHCAILVHGYGDGLNKTTLAPPTQDTSRPVSSVYSEHSVKSVLPEGAGPETSWLRPKTPSAPHSRNTSSTGWNAHSRSQTPLLDSDQLDLPTSVTPQNAGTEPPSRSDSTSSTCSSVWSEGASASSKSSAGGEYSASNASPAEHSGLLGGLVSISSTPIESPRTRSMTRASIPQSHIHPLLRRPSKPKAFHFRFNNHVSKPTHTSPEIDTADSTIGVAFSAPASPPLSAISDSQMAPPSIDALSSMEQQRPSPPPRSITIDQTPILTSTPRIQSDNTETTLNSPPSGVWEQYRAALTRQESASYPPSFTKPAHAFRLPSFRLPVKPSTDEESGKKKERRLSSLWRR